MIRPAGFRGVAFGTAEDGDPRTDPEARARWTRALGVDDEWAVVHQVHGSCVVRVAAGGAHGEADGLVTATPGVALAVATADCLPVVLEGAGSVALVHAGWRGLAAGVLAAAVEEMRQLGDEPLRAAIGPGIGPCRYEVGPELGERFPEAVSRTSVGTRSVDLVAAARRRLAGIPLWVSDRCTYEDRRLHSHRRDGTRRRQVAVAWLPSA